MIKTALITLIGTGLLGTGAAQTDIAPKSTEVTAGFFTVEFGGDEGFQTRFADKMDFNIKLKTKSGKSLTIRL